MSILNEYKQRALRLVVNRTNIMDVVVCDDATINYESVNYTNGRLSSDSLIAYIDMSIPNKDNEDGYIESLEGYYYKNWGDEDICLEDDELTGYDNGFLSIDEEREFDGDCKHFFINKEDKYLTLYPIIKNEDDLELTDNSIIFNGGFVQGFYKLFGLPYETLPQYIENNEWNLEFLIKPYQQYDENNEGVFFYMGTRAENKFANFYNTNSEAENEKTSNGVLLDRNNYFEIKTDNKYLPEIVSGYTREYETEIGNNAYLIFSQNPKDYTVENIEEFYQSDKYLKPKYNVKHDLYGNAFSLFITNDGEIGYRYLINKCEEDFDDNFIVEKTFKNTVRLNEWSTINVKFIILNGETDDCGVPFGRRKMKIQIYVNGYLRFISQELPELNFRELNDIYQKQEMVPFNISLGGGSLGLSESKLVFEDKILELNDFGYISTYFNKRFYGELKTFKFYNGTLTINQIRNNYYYNLKNK